MKEIVTRKFEYLAIIAILVLVLVGVFVASRPVAVQTSSNPTRKTIQVSAVGTVSATPDETILRLAVLTQSYTATQATQENAVAMASVIQALVNLGVASDSLKTVTYSLTTIYDNAKSPPRLVGYSARNEIQVTLTNISITGKAIDAAVAAGANEVDEVTFTLTAQTYATLQKQALQMAIKDASGQAQAIASGLGLRIVGPITVTTVYSYQPSVSRLGANVLTPIQPGTLQISTSIQVTYEVTPV
jgi:hypothetical protein